MRYCQFERSSTQDKQVQVFVFPTRLLFFLLDFWHGTWWVGICKRLTSRSGAHDHVHWVSASSLCRHCHARGLCQITSIKGQLDWTDNPDHQLCQVDELVQDRVTDIWHATSVSPTHARFAKKHHLALRMSGHTILDSIGNMPCHPQSAHSCHANMVRSFHILQKREWLSSWDLQWSLRSL